MSKIDLTNFKNGTTQDWKFGLATRSVYRVDDDKFELDDTSCGWTKAFVNKETLVKLIGGKMSLLDLDWS